MEENTIICGDCLEVMPPIPTNSIDAIVTDPPYGLGFMGKEWDTFKPEVVAQNMKRDTRTQKRRQLYGGRESDAPSAAMAAGRYDHSRNAEFQQWFTVWAKEVLRIAKPGAMMLIFGGTRTFHRLTCAIEDAGWQIRDCMMWLYGSGFPKSLDISKAIDKAKGTEREVIGTKLGRPGMAKDGSNQRSGFDNCFGGKEGSLMSTDITTPATDLAKLWDGYGTALKPAWEPIIVAMKPLDGTFAANAEKWGVAGLNVDGGRISLNGEKQPSGSAKRVYKNNQFTTEKIYGDNTTTPPQGRWPANVILDEEVAAMLDEQSGESKSTPHLHNHKQETQIYGGGKGLGIRSEVSQFADSGGASRFFYCAKASRAERNAGLDGMPLGEPPASARSKPAEGRQSALGSPRQNSHPTVKPLALMKYLCRLVKPPTDNPILLDPFAGSGTTLMAAVFEDWNYIGIEKDKSYCEIAEKRAAWAKKQKQNQASLFGANNGGG